MKNEVFEYFKERGFLFSELKKRNRDIQPAHIKAGMVEIWRNRKNFRDDQLARAALRAAKEIDAREEYENDLKLNEAIKDLAEEREKNKDLKRKLLIWYLLLGFFVWTGFMFVYPYLGQIWERIR